MEVEGHSLGATRGMGSDQLPLPPSQSRLLPRPSFLVLLVCPSRIIRDRLLAPPLARIRLGHPRRPPARHPPRSAVRVCRPAPHPGVNATGARGLLAALLRWADSHDAALELVQRGRAGRVARKVLECRPGGEGWGARDSPELAGPAGDVQGGCQEQDWRVPGGHGRDRDSL